MTNAKPTNVRLLLILDTAGFTRRVKTVQKNWTKYYNFTNFSILEIKTQNKLNFYLLKSKEALKEKKLGNYYVI